MSLPKRPATKAFKGLNNVQDPIRLGASWLSKADNIDITDTGSIQRAKGYTRKTTNTAITGAYATADLQRCYLIDNGELREMAPGLASYRVLRTGLSAPLYSFTEANGQVFYTNGIDRGLITAAGAAQNWGISAPSTPNVVLGTGSLDAGAYHVVLTATDARGLESGNSDVASLAVTAGGAIAVTDIPAISGMTINVYVTRPNGTVFYLAATNAVGSVTITGIANLGRELPFWNHTEPRGEQPAFFQGRIYCTEAMPSLDVSIVWRSKPLHYHHFEPSEEAFAVPGTTLLLAATSTAATSGTGFEKGSLIIGTERAVWAYDGETLMQISDYGVVPGFHDSSDGDNLYFWTLRGLCRAMPFENLTESTVSVPPGLSAGGMVLEIDGMRRYIVALTKGGAAYNGRIT